MDLFLEDIYHSQSLLIVHDVSQSYADRAWTQTEWRAVRALKHELRTPGNKDARWRFLPIRFQAGDVPGVYKIDGILDARRVPISRLAEVIHQRIRRLESLMKGLMPAVSTQPRSTIVRAAIDDQPFPPSRLPAHADSGLVGREKELAMLDKAWTSKSPTKVNIVTLVAFGGQGKTALVKNWVARLAHQGWNEYEAATDWSFYSQGSSSNRAAGADTFVAWTLAWLGDPAPTVGTPWERGSRLGALISKRRLLLILDGLEPLQSPPGPDSGKIKDPLVSAMLLTLARSNKGLCVITTRHEVADLQSFESTTCPRYDLGQLSQSAGVALLSGMGLKGSRASFEAAVRGANGHALTLTLLGRFIKNSQPDRDIGHWKEVLGQPETLSSDTGHHTRTVLQSYVDWLGPQTSACCLLRLLGLFDRPAEQDSLRAVCQRPTLPATTEALTGITDAKWHQSVEHLRALGLIFDSGSDGAAKQAIDCHPLIREYFRLELQKDREIWIQANLRLFEHYKPRTRAKVRRIEDLQPMFFAVVHGCRAFRYREALEKVYLPHIVRGDEFFAVQRFGALGSLLSALAYFFEENKWGVPVARSPQVPNGLDKKQQSIVLNHAIALLTETEGYSSANARRCIQEAQRLTGNLKDSVSQYPLAVAVWRDSVGSEMIRVTEAYARRVTRLARSLKTDSAMLGAYRTEGLTAFIAGDFRKVRRAAIAGISLAKTKDAYSRAMIHSVEPSISCRSYLSLALWHLGHTDEALRESIGAFRDAEKFPHMHTAVVTRYWQQFLWQFLDDAGRVQHEAGKLLELALAHGFRAWAAAAKVFHGWAVCRTTLTVDGLAEVVEGIQEWQAARLNTFVPYFTSMQAQCVSRTDPVAALSLLKKAEALSKERGDVSWLPEIQRMHATIEPTQNPSAAESGLRQALLSARRLNSRALELRILNSLAERSKWWLSRLRKAREFFPPVPSSPDESRAAKLLIGAV